MKPSARIKAVEEILDRVFEARIPMDLVVGDYMRGRRYIGSKDRAFIAEKSYDLMRHYARAQWICDKLKTGFTPRHMVIVYLICFQETSLKRLQDLFDEGKYAPEPLSSQETDMIEYLQANKAALIKKMPERVLLECPEDCHSDLKSRFGDQFSEEMTAFHNSAHLDLRVNISKISRQEAQDSLKKDGVETDKTPYSPWGLRCRNKVHLAKISVFKKGLVEIQDEGSQLIAFLCDPRPGLQILDYCAGGGGKTLALSTSMQAKGRLVATDIDGRRLKNTNERLKRAGLSDNVEVRPLDEPRHLKWRKRQKENFDRVLVDAPCSGTGTWRRNPDARWFRHGPDLEELIQTQEEILDKVAGIPKSGGYLVYATCSILPQENERQIEKFLSKYSDYNVVPMENAWPENHDFPEVFKGKEFMSLSPLLHNTDGFFAAVLKRN